MSTTVDLVFDNIEVPLALLNQSLLRIHRAGWVVEHIAWAGDKKSALVVASTTTRLVPLQGVVLAPETIAGWAEAGVVMGVGKVR